MLQVPAQRHARILLEGRGIGVSLLANNATPKPPLEAWVFDIEAHPLPMQGAPAKEAVRHQYSSEAEMTHRLSGCCKLHSCL